MPTLPMDTGSSGELQGLAQGHARVRAVPHFHSSVCNFIFFIRKINQETFVAAAEIQGTTHEKGEAVVQ